MDMPAWLLVPYFHVLQGFVNITTGVGQVIGADPTRIYLALIFEGSLTGNVRPDGYPAGHTGFKILTTSNFIEFNFRDHPGLVGLGWTATVSAPGDVAFISIGYKPEYEE